MKMYRVYGWSNGGLVSVYDEIIKANSQAEAIKQAIKWNIEESCTGKYNARYNRIEYFSKFGITTIEHFFAIER